MIRFIFRRNSMALYPQNILQMMIHLYKIFFFSKSFICGYLKDDFQKINRYQIYGFSFFKANGYKERKQEFKIYPVQILFSDFEYKLRRLKPGEEIHTVYTLYISNLWPCGRVIMYFEEENKYGSVRLSTNGKPLQDLNNNEILSNAFIKLPPQTVNKENSTNKFENYKDFTIKLSKFIAVLESRQKVTSYKR